MVLLEQFKLYELKYIFKKIKDKYFILLDYQLYKLNKYDIITILRNTRKFDENDDDYLYFKQDGNRKIRFKVQKSKRYFKGIRIEKGFFKTLIPIILNFD